jgi:dihydrofolate synthase / folylpolyglutamate synthase
VRSIFQLFPSNATCYFSEFNSKRTTKLAVFQKLATEFNLSANFFETSGDAMAMAYEAAGENDLIAVFGSFYLVQELL